MQAFPLKLQFCIRVSATKEMLDMGLLTISGRFCHGDRKMYRTKPSQCSSLGVMIDTDSMI